MKQIARRDRLKIYSELLMILRDETRKEKFSLTTVQIRLNVPYDRLKKYVSELNNLGLIENEISFRLTEKGTKYITEYEKILEFMKKMGISYQ